MEICIRPENAPSLRVVEKLGFRYEGLRRRFIHINGDWRDHFCFALTVEELPQGVLRRWKDGKVPAVGFVPESDKTARAEGDPPGLSGSAQIQTNGTVAVRMAVTVKIDMPMRDEDPLHPQRPHDRRDAEEEQRDRHQRGVERRAGRPAAPSWSPSCAQRRRRSSASSS